MIPAAEYYDRLAPIYDHATAEPTAWTPPAVVGEKLLEHSRPEDVVLDIGIGTGRSIEDLVARGRYSRIEGIEPSKLMLDRCAEKYPHVKLHHGDILTYQWSSPHTFSIIVCSGTLEFLPNLEAFLTICKWLATEDAILIVTYEPIITGHAVQAKEQSLVVEDRQSKLFVDGFFTYRRHPHLVASAFSRIGFNIEHDSEFVSYKKLGSDIIYHLLIARRMLGRSGL